MSRRTTKATVRALLAAGIFSGAQALAAPLQTTATLPLDSTDIEAIRAKLGGDEAALTAFLATVSAVQVFPDHTNPRDAEGLGNRGRTKNFYAGPYFTPSAERSVVGAQEIARTGLEVLAKLDELSESFDFELARYQEATQRLAQKEKALARVETTLAGSGLAADEKARLERLAASLRSDVAKHEAERAAVLAGGANGMSAVAASYRTAVANQITLQLARLGVAPTAAEKADLESAAPARMVNGIASLRARAANGQFGLRQAVLEHGMTADKKRFLSLYRQQRPDVKILPLPTQAVYARSAAQSAAGASANGTLSGPMMIRGVNVGTAGKCGNVNACNVVIEYTALGAEAAQMATTGAVLLPVTFEAEVKVVQPTFVGGVSCDFRTGWYAKGRADVKDGAVIYDGDVYNGIKFDSFADGQGCKLRIDEGDSESAAYHALQKVYDDYVSMQRERTQRAQSDKAAYEQHVRREIQAHADRAQRGESDSFHWRQLTSWAGALGGGWGVVATFVVGEARSFYWHTRVEDTHSIDTVRFSTEISLRNVQATKTFAFDAAPIACWARPDGVGTAPVMVACPEARLKAADTEVGKSTSACPQGSQRAQCVEDVEAAPVGDDGVITDPWA